MFVAPEEEEEEGGNTREALFWARSSWAWTEGGSKGGNGIPKRRRDKPSFLSLGKERKKREKTNQKFPSPFSPLDRDDGDPQRKRKKEEGMSLSIFHRACLPATTDLNFWGDHFSFSSPFSPCCPKIFPGHDGMREVKFGSEEGA